MLMKALGQAEGASVIKQLLFFSLLRDPRKKEEMLVDMKKIKEKLDSLKEATV